MATNNELRTILTSDVQGSLDGTNTRLMATIATSVTMSGRKDDLLLDIPENDNEADAQTILDVNELQEKATYLGSLIQSE